MTADTGNEAGQNTERVRAWHTRFNDTLAARDIDLYLALFQENCALQVNNAFPIYSKRSLEVPYQQHLSSFRSMSYEFLSIVGDAQKSSAEVLYTFKRNDGSDAVVQCSYSVDLDEAGLIRSVRIYGNAARVFKPFMRAND